MIGATTIAEYRKYIEKDAALERRFQPNTVEEPDEKQCEEIFKRNCGNVMRRIIMYRLQTMRFRRQFHYLPVISVTRFSSGQSN